VGAFGDRKGIEVAVSIPSMRWKNKTRTLIYHQLDKHT